MEKETWTWEEVEEFGRKAFYEGRKLASPVTELERLERNVPIFKVDTYNSYLMNLGEEVEPIVEEEAHKISGALIELDEAITRLQEKYDENGKGNSPMIKLLRLEAHIDATIKIWKDSWKKMKNEGKGKG